MRKAAGSTVVGLGGVLADVPGVAAMVAMPWVLTGWSGVEVAFKVIGTLAGMACSLYVWRQKVAIVSVQGLRRPLSGNARALSEVASVSVVPKRRFGARSHCLRVSFIDGTSWVIPMGSRRIRDCEAIGRYLHVSS